MREDKFKNNFVFMMMIAKITYTTVITLNVSITLHEKLAKTVVSIGLFWVSFMPFSYNIYQYFMC